MHPPHGTRTAITRLLETGLPATDYPADPYPGSMPDFSFLAAGSPGRVWPLLPDPATSSGWRLAPADDSGLPVTHAGDHEREAGAELDDALAANGELPLAQRIPVLAYGSNRCPEKIDWLRAELGLRGTVVAISVRTTGVAGVWAAGVRARDGQRPATLAAADAAVAEDHVVWWCTPDQLGVLDVCEGRGHRYRLSRLRDGTAADAARRRYPELFVYTGLPGETPETAADSRLPLLVDGAPVRCAEVRQAAARALTGRAATTDGLEVSTVDGAPEPVEWPREVFVYGTLRPGAVAWPRLEPFAAGPPRRTAVAGTLVDTGRGYPALIVARQVPESAPVAGWAVPVRDPAAAFAALDDYEGPDYQRVRAAAIDGTPCWTYRWSPRLAGGTVLDHGRAPSRRTTE